MHGVNRYFEEKIEDKSSRDYEKFSLIIYETNWNVSINVLGAQYQKSVFFHCN